MADCITAMFRLDTEKTINSLIPTCFDNGAPIIFKMSFVKAALAIASEENRLPSIISISTLYMPLCTRIRKLFLELFNRDHREKSDTASQHSSASSSRKVMNTSDKRSSKTRSSSHERSELILDVLKLYQADPNMAVLVIYKRGFYFIYLFL
jgi:neurofibromin 1